MTNFGYKQTKEHKQKLSEAKLKNPVRYWKGKKRSEETKIKISKAKSGFNHHMWGKHVSEEVKRKISNSEKGKILSNETKNKIKKARLKQIIPIKDTLPERILQKTLDDLNIKYNKHKAIIGQPDLFIEPNICIFADGDYWHNIPDQTTKDVMINTTLTKQGYKVLRFWEHNIKNDIETCKNKILEVINE